MQTVKIPVSIDPIRAASSRLDFQGVVPGKQLKRLNELCAGDCSDVTVSLECGVDLQGIVYLKGKAVTELTLICQRCMTLFTTEVTVDFCFSPCRTEAEIDELPDAYDPIECNEIGEIRLHQLIEDELILAVPLIPAHEDNDCSLGSQDMVVGEIDPAQEERPNPFAVLEKLKSK
ncbi:MULTISPECIES: 23S rRNA accumulation protein YceD [Shewanella]|uniref:Large ribosomal RNA subunit accumulation protein YceD n=2 Tax=Shewanella TaxID=22 RepID=A0A974XN71_9GAMM|nr:MULTISPECIES: 23S rRNA accumulation protein YceD [Shewanella]QSX31474.1 23S rRNA accumulation protein YceD [Shewanella cyperi]QSX38700.1 23S rRNA accumulation protein YceD [Shewanella sedimentimangrovi]QSX42259.1 23S rRNA accumulation protein YceD [Shewanella cyperi]